MSCTNNTGVNFEGKKGKKNSRLRTTRRGTIIKTFLFLITGVPKSVRITKKIKRKTGVPKSVRSTKKLKGNWVFQKSVRIIIKKRKLGVPKSLRLIKKLTGKWVSQKVSG